MKIGDSFDPYEPKRGNIFLNPGFGFGFIGALIAIAINLLLILINAGDNRGDLFAWLLQFLIYYFAARAAAENQYNQNMRLGQLDHLQGVRAAGVGAALVTSILVWIYIVIRGVVRDAFGVFIIVDPIGLFCLVVVDVLIALGIGALGGNSVVKHYQV